MLRGWPLNAIHSSALCTLFGGCDIQRLVLSIGAANKIGHRRVVA